MRRYALAWMATLLLLTSPRARAGDKETILVIVNKAVAVGSLSREELRPIFQTKKNTWPDGSALRAFNLPETDAARRGFDAAVLGLDPDRVVRYWIDRKIRGGDRPPQLAPSAAVMLKVVGATPGAIGYVDSHVALPPNVKVLAKVSGGMVTGP
jgi:ABC-type phosphate transport system substrate-binding protein